MQLSLLLKYFFIQNKVNSSIMKCPDCCSVNTGIENSIEICFDCGTVVNEIPVRIEQGHGEYHNNVAVNKVSVKNKSVGDYFKYYTAKLIPRKTSPVRHGIDVIINVGKNLNIPYSMLQTAKSLFEEISMSQPFKKDFSNTKLCLALSCLYVVSNRDFHPITLNDLLNNSDCAFDHFGAVFLRLEKHYPNLYPNKSKNIEVLVPYHLFKLTINDKEKLTIADYATNLLWMWREAMLVQSYNPVYVIYSAFYFAWKAMSVDRYQMSCTEFCKRVKIEHKPIISQRATFYQQILRDFYRCNPLHASETIHPNLICSKIKEIIAMKRIILWNYNKSQLNYHTQEIKKRKNDDVEVPEMSAKKIRASIKAESDDDDEDISDSEIESYIRSSDEVYCLKKLKDASDECDRGDELQEV